MNRQRREAEPPNVVQIPRNPDRVANCTGSTFDKFTDLLAEQHRNNDQVPSSDLLEEAKLAITEPVPGVGPYQIEHNNLIEVGQQSMAKKRVLWEKEGLSEEQLRMKLQPQSEALAALQSIIPQTPNINMSPEWNGEDNTDKILPIRRDSESVTICTMGVFAIFAQLLSMQDTKDLKNDQIADLLNQATMDVTRNISGIGPYQIELDNLIAVGQSITNQQQIRLDGTGGPNSPSAQKLENQKKALEVLESMLPPQPKR